jgi:hypothetical protein
MAFDAYNYFEQICSTNKLTSAGKYKFCKVSGMSYMEEVIQKFKTEKAYFCVDDTEDGNIIQQGGGYVERRQYVVFLIKKFAFGKMDEQHTALDECRQIYRQIVKKLIRDRRFLENEMTYLKVDRIPFYEIPGYFISGCTGLYFMITIDIPTELCYDDNDWI